MRSIDAAASGVDQRRVRRAGRPVGPREPRIDVHDRDVVPYSRGPARSPAGSTRPWWSRTRARCRFIDVATLGSTCRAASRSPAPDVTLTISPPPCAAQVREHRADQGERSVDVDVELVQPGGTWHLVDRRGAAVRLGGVVDQDVDAVELRDRGGDERFEVSTTSTSVRTASALPAAGLDRGHRLTDRARETAMRVDGARRDDHGHAAAAQLQRDLSPDPRLAPVTIATRPSSSFTRLRVGACFVLRWRARSAAPHASS